MTTEQSKQGIHYTNFLPVIELRSERGNSAIIGNCPILYRWWFPETSPIVIYWKEYLKRNPEDSEAHYVQSSLKHKTIGDITYYALYLGKSTNGRTRFGQHINGPIKQSTLRETIRAILSINGLACDKTDISNILNDCCFEWMEFEYDSELVDCIETIAITLGKYPLNLDSNSFLINTWGKIILEKREELKDY